MGNVLPGVPSAVEKQGSEEAPYLGQLQVTPQTSSKGKCTYIALSPLEADGRTMVHIFFSPYSNSEGTPGLLLSLSPTCNDTNDIRHEEPLLSRQT